MPNPLGAKAGDDVLARLDELSAKLETERRMREVTDHIHTASLDEIIISVREDVQRLVGCERVTIFAKDPQKEDLLSKSMDGDEVREIRLPIASNSIAGYTALKKKLVRVSDVYDSKALAAVDPILRFDTQWDKKTGFKTKQMLSVPIMKDAKLFGVIECMNAPHGMGFREDHMVIVEDLAKTLATAFSNQQRISARTSPFDALVRSGRITQDQVDQATGIAQKNGFSPETALILNFKLTKDEVGKSLSEYYRVPFMAFTSGVTPPVELLEKFTHDLLKHHSFVPVNKAGNRATVLMANPKNLQLRDDIARRLGADVIVNVSIKEDINEYIDAFLGQAQKSAGSAEFNALMSEIASDNASMGKEEDKADVSKDQDRANEAALVKLVNAIIVKANDMGASDIHIEPRLDGPVGVRIRIDGSCILMPDLPEIPNGSGRAMVARIKIMSNLDIAERRFPQDGKIPFKKYGPRDIELRVATIPTTGGMEDAVLRILAASKPIPIEKLGMEADNLEKFIRIAQEPYGIFLCVGPTGSGKTTTLHSGLGYLNKPDVKIWTAEDPVEITQVGLRQVSVMPKIGFTFEKALRSFLRLDPDIIMIGEMRDLETASAAIEASLTGHMVFSTLHTNNAPETVTRLLDMGLDPYTFGDSLLGILAQRLLRTLCKECKEKYTPDEGEFEKLKREFGDDALWDKQGYVREKTELCRARGCERCNKSGYKGRAGIHELLAVDDEIRHLIYGKQLSSKIRELAIKKGMVMLKQDGIRKIMKGLTDLGEVRSVCMK
ncbi:MAG TPA: GspE/PulE family protein [Planctomycetota bacterium]|nr:GspE/PulE family protein [Planctomycetota bacterium]